MSLEGFVDFMDDSSIVQASLYKSIKANCTMITVTTTQTHVPRDENDDPSSEFCTLLDAVRLITLVPRNLGVSNSDTYYSEDSTSKRLL